jgi:hypothetical protein
LIGRRGLLPQRTSSEPLLLLFPSTLIGRTDAAQIGDYAYSEGEAYSFRFVHPTLTLHGKIVQEETDQLVVRDVLIALPLSHLDHVFGTSHQK